jgi:hypothetical protein
MLWVMPGAWIVIASLVLGPPTPPPPHISGPAEAPIEGPAPQGDPSEAEDEAAEPPGIEFAPPPTLEPGPSAIEVPPPPEGHEGIQEGPAALTEDASLWPDPGSAPSNGAGMFVAAGVTIPAGILVPLGLLQDPALTDADRVGIIGVAAGMGLIGSLGLGLAVSRRVKLVRWAGAYRVQPTPQGSGLLTFGGIALTAGATLVPLGLWIMGRGGSMPHANAMLIGGTVSLGISPLGLVVGKRYRNAYLTTGGWIRRPMPQITLAPRVLVLPGGFGVAFAGRF